jgi:hypothetical protein
MFFSMSLAIRQHHAQRLGRIETLRILRARIDAKERALKDPSLNEEQGRELVEELKRLNKSRGQLEAQL